VGFLRVPHLPLEDQLRLVVEHFGLIRRQSRCMVCSGGLDTIPREVVSGRVPSSVLRDHERFFLCQDCGRVFWHGSHWQRISDRLDRVFV
jgi:uncharacterized protein